MTKHTSKSVNSVTLLPFGDLEEELAWWGNEGIFPALSVWKRDFMTGGPDNEGGYPAYPVVEKLKKIGVEILPLLIVITQTRHLIETTPVIALQRSIASKKEREEDAKKLDEAARICAKWATVLSIGIIPKGEQDWDVVLTPYPSPKSLSWVADCLRKFGPAKKGRPVEVPIQNCALKLEKFIKSQTGSPHYFEIGELLTAAFPEYFNPKGDFGQATIKLLARARRRKSS